MSFINFSFVLMLLLKYSLADFSGGIANGNKFLYKNESLPTCCHLLQIELALARSIGFKKDKLS
jgi:hypothetical protein